MARRDAQQKKKSDEWQLRTAHLICVWRAAAREANEIFVFSFSIFELFAEADGMLMMDYSVPSQAVNWYT